MICKKKIPYLRHNYAYIPTAGQVIGSYLSAGFTARGMNSVPCTLKASDPPIAGNTEGSCWGQKGLAYVAVHVDSKQSQ